MRWYQKFDIGVTWAAAPQAVAVLCAQQADDFTCTNLAAQNSHLDMHKLDVSGAIESPINLSL